MCVNPVPIVTDLGLRPYAEVWDMQKTLFSRMVERKKQHLPVEEEHLMIVEHLPVITFGKHAKEANLLASGDLLKSRGVDCFHIERGGDITYHGPGQIVIYPIIDLEKHKLGVKDYVSLLEECVIRTIAEYGIRGERVEGASGVWIGKGTPTERKICALGVKCSRFITMHGLALNVNTDLSGFSLINPCGFVDKGVTSMAAEKGEVLDIAEVKRRLSTHFLNLLSSKD